MIDSKCSRGKTSNGTATRWFPTTTWPTFGNRLRRSTLLQERCTWRTETCRRPRATLRRAIEVCPHSAIEPRQVLAWFYQKQGRTDRALAELAELKEGAMEDPAVCLTLGQLYDQLGEFERAEQAYKRLVEISPHRGGGYAALANLYLQANRNIPEARTLAQKAVELEPVALYYFQLALACQRAGDRSSAIAAIEEAMARESGNSDYRQLRERLEKQPMDASLPVVP